MAAAIHLIFRRLMAALFAVLIGLWAAEGFPLHGTSPQRAPALGWITGVAVFVVAEILGQRGERRDARRRALAHAQAVMVDEQLRAAAREAHNRPLPGTAPQTPTGKPRLYAVPDAPQDAPERHRSRLVPLLAVAVVLLAPLVRAGIASARHYSPIQAAYTVAARYWHQQPCAGHIKIVVEAPWSNDAANPAGVPTSMWASWDAGTRYENDEAAPQPFTSCVIGINALVWRSARQEGEVMWPDFATGMAHEFHHLMGYGDLFAPADSGSIDYITPSDLPTRVTGEHAPGWG